LAVLKGYTKILAEFVRDEISNAGFETNLNRNGAVCSGAISSDEQQNMHSRRRVYHTEFKG